MAGILILPPLITNLVNETTGFLIVCVISIIIGIVESISQSNLIGLIATLPSKYSKYLMVGNGLSGVIISSSRLFCLGVFPLDNSGYFYSTLLYFAICAAILSICVGIQGHIMKHPLVFEGLRKTHAKESRKTAVSEGSTCEYSLDLKVKTKKPADIAKLMNEIWHYMLLIWINYVITFGMLSHVSLATSSEEFSYPVFSTLLIWTFNIFDSIGRYCPLVYTIENAALKFFTCARICFWVSFIIIASDSPKISPEWLFQSDWFKFINMALYAFSNGYMSTCIMSLGLSKAPKETKDKAGYFMAAALLFGIFCGQALSYTFTNVGRTPTSL